MKIDTRQKSAHFEPDKFEDHYEAALQELLLKKAKRHAAADRTKMSST
jgi:DNA end-binding protein Ku